jgi:pimeloyl-ACP methyl ester carboxylesterase
MDYDAVFAHFCETHPRTVQQIDGAEWQYIACGHGATTLVLLPGGFGLAETAFRYVLACEPACRVIAVTYPTTISTVAGLTDGLACLLRRNRVERAHVLGGSYSGMVAQCFVRRYPALVHTLILSHTGAPRPSRARWSQACMALLEVLPMPLLRGMLRLMNYGFLPGHTPEQRFWRRHFARMIDKTTRADYLNRLHVLQDFDRNYRFTPDDLRDHAVPILLIEAARDGMVGEHERAALRQLYPAARRHVFPQGSHAETVTRPEAEIDVIMHWIAAH